MLTKRIIPCLDVKDGRVVKGVNFVNLRDAGDPCDNARVYNDEGADEIVFLDITASFEGRKTMVDVVKRVAEVVFMPLTVGGGINTLNDIKELLAAGCDKVSINTAAVKRPAFVKEAAKRFGSQCIVVAIDARRGRDDERKKRGKAVNPSQKSPTFIPSDGCTLFSAREGASAKSPKGSAKVDKWEVYINGGRTPTGLDALLWAKEAERLGAGEILLTSMDYDGTKAGYDIELTRTISEAVNIPVIASGGAGDLEHLYEALVKGKADAVLAASIFHYREYSIRQAKEYLAKKGVAVRLWI